MVSVYCWFPCLTYVKPQWDRIALSAGSQGRLQNGFPALPLSPGHGRKGGISEIQRHLDRRHRRTASNQTRPFILLSVPSIFSHPFTHPFIHPSLFSITQGECRVMGQNPRNAVMCLGHNNGTVTMWTPNLSTPVLKLLVHKSPLLSLAVDDSGNYLTTSALDGQVKVWDLRNFKNLHSYFSVRPATDLAISQTGLLAVGAGPHLQVRE